MLEQINRQVAQDGQVGRRMIFADAATVFVEGDIQDPMQAIFDAPMLAGGLENALGIRFQTGDEITGFDGLFAIYDPAADEQHQTLQADPLGTLWDTSQIFGVCGYPTFPDVNAPMPFLDFFGIGIRLSLIHI